MNCSTSRTTNGVRCKPSTLGMALTNLLPRPERCEIKGLTSAKEPSASPSNNQNGRPRLMRTLRRRWQLSTSICTARSTLMTFFLLPKPSTDQPAPKDEDGFEPIEEEKSDEELTLEQEWDLLSPKRSQESTPTTSLSPQVGIANKAPLATPLPVLANSPDSSAASPDATLVPRSDLASPPVKVATKGSKPPKPTHEETPLVPKSVNPRWWQSRIDFYLYKLKGRPSIPGTVVAQLEEIGETMPEFLGTLLVKINKNPHNRNNVNDLCSYWALRLDAEKVRVIRQYSRTCSTANICLCALQMAFLEFDPPVKMTCDHDWVFQ